MEARFRATNGEGLTTDEIQSLAEDSDGELWIGTESGGAMGLAQQICKLRKD